MAARLPEEVCKAAGVEGAQQGRPVGWTAPVAMPRRPLQHWHLGLDDGHAAVLVAWGCKCDALAVCVDCFSSKIVVLVAYK